MRPPRGQGCACPRGDSGRGKSGCKGPGGPSRPARPAPRLGGGGGGGGGGEKGSARCGGSHPARHAPHGAWGGVGGGVGVGSDTAARVEAAYALAWGSAAVCDPGDAARTEQELGGPRGEREGDAAGGGG